MARALALPDEAIPNFVEDYLPIRVRCRAGFRYAAKNKSAATQPPALAKT